MFQNKRMSKAIPIWAEGKTKEVNCSLWFETEIEKNRDILLRIAGSNEYQIFINGDFCFYGPARSGRGYYRVDEVPISKFLTGEQNKVEILASAYNIDNYCFLNEEGFICAEFVSGDRVFGETGSDAWHIRSYPQKVRKTQRYSFQRPFAEVYDYQRTDKGTFLPAMVCQPKNFIAREVPYPTFDREKIGGIVCRGGVSRNQPTDLFRDRAIVNAGNGVIGGFPVDELEICSIWEAQKLALCPNVGELPKSLPLELSAETYVQVETQSVCTGFIQLDAVCGKDADLFITFDEILNEKGEINSTHLEVSNVIVYKLRRGERYHLVSTQPYSLKYLNVICMSGEIEIDYIGVVRLEFNQKNIIKKVSAKADPKIAKIYSAAVASFRQNVVDIYMDCPSRERAGWLCDSFFISRVERLLTGKTMVEHAFLSNFAMEDTYQKNIPDGMLPMCYPAEHPDGTFIPNWAMWYVLELKEFFAHTRDKAFVGDLKDKLYRLLNYFRRFENADGLLEKLEKWVFVEWSRANDLTQDINYPTNMLYYAFLNTMGELYDDEMLIKKAERLKNVIREKSRHGMFFCDHAVYQDGKAVLDEESTEVCQYYAFVMGIADFKTDRALWETLVNDFGPERKIKNKYPNIAFANSFMGNYFRLDLLMKDGRKLQLEKEIKGFFLKMAERTGTLWEHDGPYWSCNHGFASHVLVWLNDLGYLENAK